ncbi:Zn-ribbon domain-containing OB-fold protein [Croceicoccus marinus]|uniref:OB-fold domain-containing protein n=1 Tax=Croceicoccus marinus TaxID=450378 RepID=A0A1Z1FGN3_9SPHN|nr:OB-fold domain-containing protein [Croceicoccus marinus]ARU17895.1 hypothetical protein A9D14_16370 [Croceicoccus marinus]QNE07402.1 OB-fold domain-containing protein [Croceicoccus marinus]
MGPERHWREALASGRLMFQRSLASGQVFFPPRLAEPGTGDRDWEWVDAPLVATIYSLTIIPARGGPDRAVALVDFDGGGRMMGDVGGRDPAALRIGMRVEARIDDSGDNPRVWFDAAKAAP